MPVFLAGLLVIAFAGTDGLDELFGNSSLAIDGSQVLPGAALPARGSRHRIATTVHRLARDLDRIGWAARQHH